MPPTPHSSSRAWVRWQVLLTGAIVFLSIWVFQGVSTLMQPHRTLTNPFAANITPPPPNRLQVSLDLQQRLNGQAQDPFSYEAILLDVRRDAILLEVEHLCLNPAPAAERQSTTALDLSGLVVETYLNQPPPDLAPEYILVLFSPELADLPSYRIQMRFADAQAFWAGWIDKSEFMGRWEYERTLY
jgi:hypothetical protein